MSSAATAAKPKAGDRLLLEFVDWDEYTRLLRAFRERRGVKLTYDQGRLEIMSPSLVHDRGSDFLGTLIYILSEELGLPLQRGGSTTLRRKKMQKGLEPDRCYWIANAAKMKGVPSLNLRIHPPPDLAFEVDVTRSSLNRMGIYAALRIPEVWRLKGTKLSFFTLKGKRGYQAISRSVAFPAIAPSDLTPFLKEAKETGDQNEVTRRFREWVRRHHRLASQ